MGEAAAPVIAGYELLVDKGFRSRHGTPYHVYTSTAPHPANGNPTLPGQWKQYCVAKTNFDQPARSLLVIRNKQQQVPVPAVVENPLPGTPDFAGYEVLVVKGFTSKHGTPYHVYTSKNPAAPGAAAPAVPAGWELYGFATTQDAPVKSFLLIRKQKDPTNPNGNGGGNIKAPPPGAKVVNKGTPLPTPQANQVIALEAGGTWAGMWSVGANGVKVVAFGDVTKRPRITANNTALQCGGDDVTFEGIEFAGTARSDIGLKFLDAKGTVTLKDCIVRDFGFGIIFEKGGTLKLVDCLVFDNFGTPFKHDQGLYTDQAATVHIDGCFFDRNGWGPGTSPDIFKHNIYIRADSKPSRFENSIFARASSHGVQARTGGTVLNCLFYENPIHLSFGHVNGGGPTFTNGVTGEVRECILVGGGHPIAAPGGPAALRGHGIDIGNVRSAEITNVVFAEGGPGEALRLEDCKMEQPNKPENKDNGIQQLKVSGCRRIRWNGKDYFRDPNAKIANAPAVVTPDLIVQDGKPPLRPIIEPELEQLRAGKTTVSAVLAKVRAAVS